MTEERRDEEARRWGSELAQRRVSSRITQEALAASCGVSHAAIRRWERGECLPADENWPALEKALPGLRRPLRSEPAPAPALPTAAQVPVATLGEQPAPPDPERPLSYEELAEQVERLQRERQHLEELTTIDPLTGVPNRRGVRQALERELSAAHRRGESLAVLCLDVDHFKRLNDAHGHPAGDEVLKAVAAALSGSVREHDVFGRIGGEEFLAVLAAVPAQRARVLAERMRAKVEALSVEGLRCTVSIGVAVHSAARRQLKDDEAEQLARQLVERADKALYWAKEGGRNRVELWSTEGEAKRAACVAAQAQAPLIQAATAMLAVRTPPPRWSLRRVGLAAACLVLFVSTTSLGGDGCGGATSNPCGTHGGEWRNGACTPIGDPCPVGECDDK